MSKSKVTFTDEHGRVLRLWEVRAGMTIVQTDYGVGHGTLKCIVQEPDDHIAARRAQLLGRSEDAATDSGEAA